MPAFVASGNILDCRLVHIEESTQGHKDYFVGGRTLLSSFQKPLFQYSFDMHLSLALNLDDIHVILLSSNLPCMMGGRILRSQDGIPRNVLQAAKTFLFPIPSV